jgi:hypothetical protein
MMRALADIYTSMSRIVAGLASCASTGLLAQSEGLTQSEQEALLDATESTPFWM